MATWYTTHFGAYEGDADTERTLLEFWEHVASGGPDPARLAQLARRAASQVRARPFEISEAGRAGA